MNLITSKNSVQLKFILLCSWVHLLSIALQTRYSGTFVKRLTTSRLMISQSWGIWMPLIFYFNCKLLSICEAGGFKLFWRNFAKKFETLYVGEFTVEIIVNNNIPLAIPLPIRVPLLPLARHQRCYGDIPTSLNLHSLLLCIICVCELLIHAQHLVYKFKFCNKLLIDKGAILSQ